MKPLFRTCPKSGLVLHRDAENLIKANAVAAVVFLAVGGLLGLLVALTRWPSVHLLDAQRFYQVLTGHGVVTLLVWVIFFEIAVLYFCSAVLLRCRIAMPRVAWTAFVLMLVGSLSARWVATFIANVISSSASTTSMHEPRRPRARL